jgi:uncharacterized protein (TIGR02284 family)
MGLREDLIACLNGLIETCRDAENGFQTAADHVSDPDLKKFLTQCSEQRAQFASELQSEVRQLGAMPAQSGSVSTAFDGGWISIESTVRGGSDELIVAECGRREDAAIENYLRVLEQSLPPNVLPVVKHQLTEIKRSHDSLKGLEEAA